MQPVPVQPVSVQQLAITAQPRGRNGGSEAHEAKILKALPVGRERYRFLKSIPATRAQRRAQWLSGKAKPAARLT